MCKSMANRNRVEIRCNISEFKDGVDLGCSFSKGNNNAASLQLYSSTRNSSAGNTLDLSFFA